MDEKTKNKTGKKKAMVPAVRQKGTLAPPAPFSAYLQEAIKYPILTEEEERE